MWPISGLWRRAKSKLQLRAKDKLETVEEYWGRHVVNRKKFSSTKESIEYLEWRFGEYPLFREFMDLYGTHNDEVIMDYGCGPGEDVIGFALFTQAKRILGLDVSAKALELARQKLALHRIAPERVELIQVSDAVPRIPLPDCLADYIYSEGVLHHTTDPAAILNEFHRVLKVGGRGCIMVYNRNSVWFHLYTAYVRRILGGDFGGMTIEEAFSRNTDGELCPIARCYSSKTFIDMCAGAGLAAEFVGGYLSRVELKCLAEHRQNALRDARLAEEHKVFLRDLTFDAQGYPLFLGRYSGIGGVYRIFKQ